jgi:hypothetical protein
MVNRGLAASGRDGVMRILSWRALLGIYTILLVLYVVAIHPWLMSWGASEAEQAMGLPGDELAPSPATYFTRAITINSPPEQVWPWLVQIGQDRAGFYSNDWLENIIADDVHNADAIHPEWQQRRFGDVVPLVPAGYLGGIAGSLVAGQPGIAFGPRIWLLDPPRAIADSPGRSVLVPIDDHTTRLLFRESIAANTPGGGIIGMIAGRVVWDPMHFVMVQRMLQGIKERVEGRPLVPPTLELAAQVGWALAGLVLVGLILSHGEGYLWLPVAIAATIPAIAFAGDINAGLAAFVVVGITVAGALVFGRRWWPAYALIAAVVLLVLALAPDAYAAFGLLFDVIVAVVLVAVVRGRMSRPTTEPTARIPTPKAA